MIDMLRCVLLYLSSLVGIIFSREHVPPMRYGCKRCAHLKDGQRGACGLCVYYSAYQPQAPLPPLQSR